MSDTPSSFINTGVNYHYINPVTILLKEELEDTKGVTRIRKSTDRQHNGQKKTNKQRFENITQCLYDVKHQ